MPKALPRTRRGRAGLGLVSGLGLLALIALVAMPAFGLTQKVLGAASPATPSCPLVRGSSQCFVEAKVTGFQLSINGRNGPFVAPWKSKVVAWSVKLGKPNKKAEKCLTDGCTTSSGKPFKGFGGPAKARLAVLKPIRRKGGRKSYELIRQSPVEDLRPYFDSTITFVLEKPLLMGKGQVAALTIPTWAPVFAGSLSNSSAWRASRNPTKSKGGCTTGSGASESANVDAGWPVQKLGARNHFTCSYKTNRLLYSASIVKAP